MIVSVEEDQERKRIVEFERELSLKKGKKRIKIKEIQAKTRHSSWFLFAQTVWMG